MRRALAALTRRTEGSVAVMSALAATCVIGCLALAVDIGSLHLEKRRLQNIADLAAIAAANNITNAETAARAILAANGVAAALAVETGWYTPDPDIAPAQRYIPGGAAPNAVRVTLSETGHLYFARVVYGGALPEIRVTATAAEQNVAQFSIGSRLASLNEGVLNDLFGDLLGTTLGLTVMDYQGLAAADLDLVRFLGALATEVGVDAGTYSSVLDADMTLGDVLDAAAVVAGQSGASAAQIALNKLGMSPGAIDALALNGMDLLGLGPLGELSLGETPAGLHAKLSAFDLARAAVFAAGEKQAAIDLGSGVPGLAGVSLAVTIGEPPQDASWITLGPQGVSVYTAQTRLRVTASVGPIGIGLAQVMVQLPLAVDIAAGRAELEEISCGRNPVVDAEVVLRVRPAIGGVHVGTPKDLGEWNAFASPDMQPAEVLNVASLAVVRASASAVATNEQDVELAFTAQDIAGRAVKTVSTNDALSTLLASSLANLHLDVELLGVPLLPGLPGLQNTVRSAVAPVAAALQPILNALLEGLGIGLGEADLRVYGVRCGTAALVM